jgi:hypothetical protein
MNLIKQLHDLNEDETDCSWPKGFIPLDKEMWEWACVNYENMGLRCQKYKEAFKMAGNTGHAFIKRVNSEEPIKPKQMDLF